MAAGRNGNSFLLTPDARNVGTILRTAGAGLLSRHPPFFQGVAVSKPLVLFHASCADGFCAAWIAHRALGDWADYVAVNYGQEPPDVTGRPVYILDFSYKRDVLDGMLQKAQSIVLLDHHKTAEAELRPFVLAGEDRPRNLTVFFDLSKSGGRLAWEYFFPGKPAPWLVDYTEDRDLWRWALPDSRAISAYIASHPFEFWRWDVWGACPIGDAPWRGWILEGEAILRYQEKVVSEQAKTAAEVEIGGYKVLAANAAEVEIGGYKVLAVNATLLTSEIAGKLAEGRPFGATFFVRKDGKKVWSLRSREGGIDVSEVAKALGGGGHRDAAGFVE
jgi:oligoribonuclease NrnB/cAMP/cGMP phosphodiesterase (DHH superfamily)